MARKMLLLLLIFFSLVGTTFDINKVRVSAAPLSPYIMVVPDETVDPTLAPGMNYTISIYTDYDGSDVWGWQFTLTFNPSILEGIEVLNGDLITRAKNTTARFYPGSGFNNTLGTLSLVSALFYYREEDPAYTTNGPGTLATVTFKVVGTGIANITLGDVTRLKGSTYDEMSDPPNIQYNIIDASLPPGATTIPYGSDHIGHGYLNNIPPIHDVAVTGLVAPAAAALGDIVAIHVTAANEGNFTETFNTTVYANTTLVNTQTVIDLASGGIETLTFNWNTTGMTVGNYVINATAWLQSDADPSDNIKIAPIEIKTIHDVAIVSLEVPIQAIVGEPAAINVTVANQGTFEENVTLAVSYKQNAPTEPEPAIIHEMNFMLAQRPTSHTIAVSWNTTGLNTQFPYTINATVIVDQDEDLSDNTLLELITLKLGHDLSVTAVSATSSKVFIGETVTIGVTIRNVGGFNETFFEVKATHDAEDIGSQQVASLPVGNSTTLSFAWNTVGVDPNIYQIVVEAILETDSNPTNNRRTILVVVAEPTGHIAGIVKDASRGNPIEGATVAAGTYTSTTNAAGYYELSDVLAGNYTVTASKNGYQTFSQTNIKVVAGQTTNLNLTLTSLPTTGHITGTVTDASNGNPIEGAQVAAGGHSASTDAAGAYSIELAAGTYNVTVSADGYQSSSEINVSVIAGATTSLDFELTPIQQLNILLYAVAIFGVIIIIAGITVYLRKGRKTK